MKASSPDIRLQLGLVFEKRPPVLAFEPLESLSSHPDRFSAESNGSGMSSLTHFPHVRR
jgi:hypothetical protein